MIIANRVCWALLFIGATCLHGQWKSAQRFSSTGTAQPSHTWSISSSFGGMVHIVWSDTRDVNSVVFYRRSTDYGETWEDEIRFVDTESNAENPGVSIAGVMNPVVHVVWDDDRDGNKEIYYKRSSDWGVTWSEDIRLTDTPVASVMPNLHGCVCCGADVRIVWIEQQPGYSAVYYKYSNDNGLTWSNDICVTEQSSIKEHPNLSFCRADVQVVWTNTQVGKSAIWGSHSIDCGNTWSPPEILSCSEHAWAGYPVIAHVDSTYHVMWTAQVNHSDTSSHGIFYRQTNDLGITWERKQLLIKHKGDHTPYVSCAAMKKNLHMTWGIPTEGLFYKLSTDNGMTWGETVDLEKPGDARNPSIAISGKSVQVVWFEQGSHGLDIFHIRNPEGNPVREE